jgi:hypothetical protein
MIFDQRPVLADRRAVDAIDNLHGMRIAHRNDADFQRFVGDVERIITTSSSCKKEFQSGKKSGNSHVDRDIAIASRCGAMMPASFRRESRACRSNPVMDEADEAARAIAALLDLAAIGIENPVAEIDIRPESAFSTSKIWSQPTPKWRSAKKA